jgi:hypothetical protein
MIKPACAASLRSPNGTEAFSKLAIGLLWPQIDQAKLSFCRSAEQRSWRSAKAHEEIRFTGRKHSSDCRSGISDRPNEISCEVFGHFRILNCRRSGAVCPRRTRSPENSDQKALPADFPKSRSMA